MRPQDHPDYIFINALRECLGLAPIWGERKRTDAERFYAEPHTLPRPQPRRSA